MTTTTGQDEFTFLRRVDSGHDGLVCVEAWNERFVMAKGYASIARHGSNALAVAQEEALNASLKRHRAVVWIGGDE